MTVSAFKFTGPLPPPEMLNAYSVEAQAVFLQMWVEEGKHRRSQEVLAATRSSERNDRLDAQSGKLATRGQWMGWTIVLAVLGAGTLAIWLGHPWTGGALIGSDLLGVLVLFMGAQGQAQRSERAERKTL